MSGALDEEVLLLLSTGILAITSLPAFASTGHRDGLLGKRRAGDVDEDGALDEEADDMQMAALQVLMHACRPRVGYGSGYISSDDLYTRLAQTPATFRALTNFWPLEFDELFSMVEALADAPVDPRGNRRAQHLQGLPRVLGASGARVGCPPKLSLRSRFFVFLAVLKGNTSLIMQIGLCGQNQQGLSDDFYHFLPCLVQALDGWLQWPDAQERAALEGTLWDFPATDAIVPIGIVDGTFCPTEVVGDHRAYLIYSGKKRAHGFNHQIVCRWDGKIIGVYPGFFGSVHDSVAYRSTPLHQQSASYFSGRQSLLADSGYEGCGLLHVRKRVTEECERTLNTKIRRHRVLIEFVIGALKSKWCILKETWKRGRGGPSNFDAAPECFYLCCQLFNFWMAKYGYLRGAAYQLRRGLEAWEAELLQNPVLRGQGFSADDEVFQIILQDKGQDLFEMLEARGVV